MQINQSKLLKNYSEITHGFTTKDGGNSVTPYSSLNLAFHVNDDKKNVEKNHELLAKKLKYNKKTLVHMKQIHSSQVHLVNYNDNFDNPPTCDALITNKTNTPLMVMVADCSPILFYDDTQQVIAVAHAGRAGAFKNIIKNVLYSFSNEFNSQMKNIKVVVGDSIQECCYEVGDEIYDEAKELNLEYALSKKEKSYYLNIGKILYKQLKSAGIKEENIEISSECTSCKNDTYFSYRADGITGRFCGVIEING